jgi:hypothetical protein
MSCGICAASKTSEQAEALCKDVMSLLVEQMAADYPKISAMKAKGERNEYILCDDAVSTLQRVPTRPRAAAYRCTDTAAESSAHHDTSGHDAWPTEGA